MITRLEKKAERLNNVAIDYKREAIDVEEARVS